MEQQPYEHRQRGYWAEIVIAILAGVVVLLVAADRRSPIVLAAVGTSALVVWIALSFNQLTLRDEGDRLLIEFGPIPLARKRIPYSRITGFERCRSSLLHGWGVHYVPWRGWIWNVWGRDCIRIDLGNKAVWVGTDDVEGLVQLLKSKMPGVRD